ncbi:exodeoxyribonuclease III, partial [bacterium]|nr:exodeoxyribonuclease III [bacterium]
MNPQNLISWNVNGLRAVLKRDPTILLDLAEKYELDAICLQETKLQPIHESAIPKVPGFDAYWCSSQEKKGYSGVAIFVKQGIPIENVEMDAVGTEKQGRMICMTFAEYHLITVYVPNSGMELGRLDYRTTGWDADLRAYVQQKMRTKSVVLCGDFNIAYLPCDFHNPKKYSQKSAGLTEEERAGFRRLLDGGMVDTFRHLYPDKTDRFSYWSAKTRARPQNKGMRIDYFLCSTDLAD